MHILLIEPNKKRAALMRRTFQRLRLAVDHVSSSDTALTRVEMRANDYDIILINAHCTCPDVLEWCRVVRERGVEQPIIALSQNHDELTIAQLLFESVDDVIRLPITPLELLARLHAVVRRPAPVHDPVITLGSFTLDVRTGTAWRMDEPCPLSTKEFSILSYLARQRGRVVPREDIIGHVWEVPAATAANTLDVHIKNIRKKLARVYECRIETVRGRGYRLTSAG